MTIKMPCPTIGDKILQFFGKKRGVIVPPDPYNKYDPYAYLKAIKENFWRAFFRSKNAPLTENIVDYDFFKKEKAKNR